MATFPAVLDACVLYPMLTRDLLLRAAEAELYRPHWSQAILDEATRNLIANPKTGMTHQGAVHLVSQMTLCFPEALIAVPPSQIDAMTNHLGDRHVAATAVVSGSSVIVTSNLRHFDSQSLRPWNIEAQSPDTFLTYLFDLYSYEMQEIVLSCAKDRGKPITVVEVSARIKNRLPTFGARLWPVFSELWAE